jgi:Flp pilus assembly protein TadG
VALPVLLLVMLGATDFARVFYTGIELTDAARAGAQYGAYNVAQSGDTATMQTTATNAVNITMNAPTASRSCFCATDTGTFSTAVLCSSTCPFWQHLVISVTVTTSKTFSPIVAFPGLPTNVSLTRTVTMRAAD